MNTHHTRPRLRRPTLIQLLIVLSAALVLATGFAAGTAQSSQDDPAPPDEKERKFENGIPAHVPLKVKLKNEQAFKNPKNKEWVKELEIEVKNTGSKPIYYLNLTLTLDDFRLEDGHAVGLSISYGRNDLMYLDTALLPEDVPIGPGESVTLKIPPDQARGYGLIRDERQKTDAKKIKFNMQFINFGDGTGLEMPVGVPSYNRRDSQKSPPPEASDRACQPPPALRAREVPAKSLKMSYHAKPASFLRVDFLSPEVSPAEPAPARVCNCQNIPNCFFGKFQCANHCPCANNCAFLAHVSTGNCSDPTARCRQVQLVHRPCPT
jgi:hypothetical protein